MQLLIYLYADLKYPITRFKAMIYRRAKHFFDFCLALFLLGLLWPLGLVISLYLSLRLKGKPFFMQQRIGQAEKPFSLYKFRTLPLNWDLLADGLPAADLQFLRDSGMDELPQLINIIAGQMSFIGPRPLLPQYLTRYESWQRERHQVRPGIIGLAQSRGGNALSWRHRFMWDVFYVQKQGFCLDLRIIAEAFRNIHRSDRGQVSPPFNGNEKS